MNESYLVIFQIFGALKEGYRILRDLEGVILVIKSTLSEDGVRKFRHFDLQLFNNTHITCFTLKKSETLTRVENHI